MAVSQLKEQANTSTLLLITNMVSLIATTMVVVWLSGGRSRRDFFPSESIRTRRMQDCCACIDPTNEDSGCTDSSFLVAFQSSSSQQLVGCENSGKFASQPIFEATTSDTFCSHGWHICRGDDPAIRMMTSVEGTTSFPGGCFAFNAAHDNGRCFPVCGDFSADINGNPFTEDLIGADMGGIGSECADYTGQALGSSCLASGRTDASTNTFGCFLDPSLEGVLCCSDLEQEETFEGGELNTLITFEEFESGTFLDTEQTAHLGVEFIAVQRLNGAPATIVSEDLTMSKPYVWNAPSWPSLLDAVSGGAISWPNAVCSIQNDCDGSVLVRFVTPRTSTGPSSSSSSTTTTNRVRVGVSAGPGGNPNAFNFLLSENVALAAYDDTGTLLAVEYASSKPTLQQGKLAFLEVAAENISQVLMVAGPRLDVFDNFQYHASWLKK